MIRPRDLLLTAVAVLMATMLALLANALWG
jgi:hypothetical protein